VSKQGTICDYAGEPLYRGDLIVYAARRGNRVRMTDAEVLRVTARKAGGRLVPMLLVRPTGDESGFSRRKALRGGYRAVWISAEHVRLLEPVN
jgi:hypothetical protein